MGYLYYSSCHLKTYTKHFELRSTKHKVQNRNAFPLVIIHNPNNSQKVGKIKENFKLWEHGRRARLALPFTTKLGQTGSVAGWVTGYSPHAESQTWDSCKWSCRSWSLPFLEGFFSGFSGFPPSLKPTPSCMRKGYGLNSGRQRRHCKLTVYLSLFTSVFDCIIPTTNNLVTWTCDLNLWPEFVTWTCEKKKNKKKIATTLENLCFCYRF